MGRRSRALIHHRTVQVILAPTTAPTMSRTMARVAKARSDWTVRLDWMGPIRRSVVHPERFRRASVAHPTAQLRQRILCQPGDRALLLRRLVSCTATRPKPKARAAEHSNGSLLFRPSQQSKQACLGSFAAPPLHSLIQITFPPFGLT